ncbi:MAG: hypothetical protein GX893_06130 [Firmicutes bacterium]|nr:hypothetical protein [Bacillota bacterium]
MRKKVTFAVFAIMLSALLVGGYTMAWFTDSATSETQEFAAGTVLIEAGSSVIGSQNFSPDEATYLYGAQADTGDLYEIDVKNKTVNKIYDMDLSADQYSPNGLGFDNTNRRLYFAMVHNSKSSTLYFYDFIMKKLVKAGTIKGAVYGGTFGEGYYWYIANNSDDLYRISFNSEGKIANTELVASITGDQKKFGFGDVAIDIRDGIIYGSSTENEDAEFFKYDISKGEYQMISGSSGINMQLAFGSDGQLYGHRTNSGNWWIININGDSLTVTAFEDLGNLAGYKFNDLASGYRSVWNPGDCELMRYYIRNTGSKRVNLRGQVWGRWFAYDEEKNEWVPWKPDSDGDVVRFELCDGSEEKWGTKNGYYYYKGIVEKDETVELCMKICLNGPKTDNQYQGKRFVLYGSFEAIQASHGASQAEWGWSAP